MPTSITDVWGCVPPIERAVDIICAEGVIAMQPYLPAQVVRAPFNVLNNAFRIKRIIAWHNYMATRPEVITVDDQQQVVIFLNKAWMIELAACRTLGNCQLNDPLCKILTFSVP